MLAAHTHRYRDPMPDKPRTKGRSMRFRRWRALGVAAEMRDTNRTAVVNQLIDWWLGTPGATLPDQLTAEEVEQIKALDIKEDLASSD